MRRVRPVPRPDPHALRRRTAAGRPAGRARQRGQESGEGAGAFVRALQLAGAASPVGAYAYSEGMEYAVFAGHPFVTRDDTSAGGWRGMDPTGRCAVAAGPVFRYQYPVSRNLGASGYGVHEGMLGPAVA